MISVDNFHKAYEGTLAVRNVSFSVQPGQILGVIGPNGAGKTTTMRSLAALIPPSRGTLTVGGHSVVEEPIEIRKQLAYIPDEPQLFPWLTVEEHLAFTAAAYGVSDADSKAATLIDTFELMAKRTAAAKDLSRGMRQKLAICCAYLYDPVAILFDEPLTGLDPLGIRMLKASIVQRAELGAAILVSSHLLAMVEDICSHILLLDHGQQRFFGTVEALKNAFPGGDDEASLEQAFFLATSQEPAMASP